jgi:hypothetical protein
VLEYEPNILVADFRQPVAIEAGNVSTGEQVAARGRIIETTDQIHERGLA